MLRDDSETMTLRWLALLRLLVGCLLVACGSSPWTGRAVDVAIDADACFRGAVSAISVRALSETGAPLEGQRLEVDGGITFPTGVRVLAEDESSARFLLEVTLFDASGTPIGFARHLGDFPATEGEVGTARILFEDACFGHLCEHTGACANAACVPSMVAPTRPARDRMPDRCPGHAFVRVEGTGDCSSPSEACADVSMALEHLGDAGGLVDVHGGNTVVMPGEGPCFSTTEGELASYPGFTIAEGVDPVVVRAWPGTGRPLIDGAGAEDTVVVHGVATLDGLELTGGRRSCAFFYGSAADGTPRPALGIRRSYVHGCGRVAGPLRTGIRMGVETRDSINAFIEDNLVRENGLSAATGSTSSMYLERVMGLRVSRNAVCNNVGSIAVLFGGATIHDNLIYANNLHGIYARTSFSVDIFNNFVCAQPGNGITFENATSRWSVTGNTFARNQNGVNLIGGSEATIRSNIVAFSGGTGIVRNAATVMHRESRNLFWMNRVDANFPTSESLVADPLFLDECGVELEAGSPANGTMDERYGAR